MAVRLCGRTGLELRRREDCHWRGGGGPACRNPVCISTWHSDSVSSVRLKINFLDGQLSGPVLEQAVSAADAILEAIGWGDEPALIASLRRLEEFEINGNGHTVSLFQEPSDIPRYNFLISSDPPGFADKDVVSPARKKWLRSPSPGN